MFHDLIRLFAFLNMALALAALVIGPVLISMSAAAADEKGEWTKEAADGLALGTAVSAYFALFTASAVGLLLHRRWGQVLTVGMAVVMTAQGVWHAIRGEWGVTAFLAGYALLAAWLLLHPINAGYFRREASEPVARGDV